VDDRRRFFCGLRVLPRGLSEPSFETGRAKPSVVAGDQHTLVDFRTRISGVWVSYDLARIIERCQSPPYEFIDASAKGINLILWIMPKSGRALLDKTYRQLSDDARGSVESGFRRNRQPTTQPTI
jgi:hypothetical protein